MDKIAFLCELLEDAPALIITHEPSTEILPDLDDSASIELAW